MALKFSIGNLAQIASTGAIPRAPPGNSGGVLARTSCGGRIGDQSDSVIYLTLGGRLAIFAAQRGQMIRHSLPQPQFINRIATRAPAVGARRPASRQPRNRQSHRQSLDPDVADESSIGPSDGNDLLDDYGITGHFIRKAGR
jgi:hypothetical protein